MPVEIRELHIKVTVNEAPQDEGAQASRNGAERSGGGAGGGADREAIVAECVEQVLRIMQNKRER
ncbi:hypothetical protein FGF66_01140 [Chlorobaculum thiosulfatiphilum]|uniref:Uncharacterized protein n=1 Tax=Chlorobaculum thiosulfatiphilum TaxID=115852 RepID=A0A5C4SB09_CHLTI|nr:DUF5908 family protein [Chlorobaculum thiosulfatiphilum]TNJ40387.1 hypothetical protein FGF66_01140 [Chlorobaculum thiosulfatiphilum]